MVKLVNKLTGSDMWVADDRLNEYLGAGHKPAPVTAKPTGPEEKKSPKEDRKQEPRKPEKPVKSGRKK